jgi:transcription elongation factor Elf1
MKTPYEKCPKCNQYNLEYGSFCVDVDNVWQPVSCNNCGFAWNEVYQFVACEDVDTTETLDELGNVATSGSSVSLPNDPYIYLSNN